MAVGSDARGPRAGAAGVPESAAAVDAVCGEGDGSGGLRPDAAGVAGSLGPVERLGRVLLAALGPQGWWPAETVEEMIVGAVLTQAVSWENARAAVQRLKAAGLCALGPLADQSPAALAPLIRCAGYYRVKAQKLVALARFFVGHGGVDAVRRMGASQARAALLAVYGVGPETADAILCYGLGHPRFVADAYARRVLGRIGLLPSADAVSYEAAAAWAETSIRGDAAWLGELHALLVAVGKAHCRKRAPRCAGCPAADLCAHRAATVHAAGPDPAGAAAGLSGCAAHHAWHGT
jgi:endonuclease-3 related protein